jgi:hypothetical protein
MLSVQQDGKYQLRTFRYQSGEFIPALYWQFTRIICSTNFIKVMLAHCWRVQEADAFV